MLLPTAGFSMSEVLASGKKNTASVGHGALLNAGFV